MRARDIALIEARLRGYPISAQADILVLLDALRDSTRLLEELHNALRAQAVGQARH